MNTIPLSYIPNFRKSWAFGSDLGSNPSSWVEEMAQYVKHLLGKHEERVWIHILLLWEKSGLEAETGGSWEACWSTILA